MIETYMYGDSSSNVLTELFVQYLSKVSEIQKSNFSKISELSDPILEIGFISLNLAFFQTYMAFSMQIYIGMAGGNHNIVNSNGI